jgi:hypothetical protein
MVVGWSTTAAVDPPKSMLLDREDQMTNRFEEIMVGLSIQTLLLVQHDLEGVQDQGLGNYSDELTIIQTVLAEKTDGDEEVPVC